MKIQTRVLLMLIPVVALSGALILLLSDASINRVLIEGLADAAALQLSDIASKINTQAQAREESAVLPLLNRVRGQLQASYAMALDSSGRVLAHTNVLEKGKVYRDSATRRSLGYTKPGFQVIKDRGKDVLDVSVPIWAREEEFLLSPEKSARERLGILRIGVPMDKTAETRYRILRRVALILFLSGAAMMLVILLFLRRVLFPIRSLAEATSLIGRGEYGVTVPVTSRDEVGELAQSFNRMSTDLAATTVSKDYLGEIIRSIMEILIVTDRQGLIQSANQATSVILGYSEKELIGKPALSLFASRPGKLPEIPYFLVLEGFIQDRELDMLAKDGHRVPVLLSSSVLINKKGAQTGLVVVAKDIKERLAAEEALRDSEERIRLLLDAVAEGICGIDLNGNCTMANNACLHLLGLGKIEEIMGKDMHELTRHSRSDGAPIPKEQCAICLASREGRPTHSEDEILQRADGTKFPAEIWSHPIWRDGKAAGAVVSFIDITERKKLESMVMQSEKLSAVGQLAAGVAHEINNPLGVILGFAQSAIRRIKDSDPLYLPVKSIERESLRCKNLVQNLLTFSRQNKSTMGAFDLNETVSDTLTIMEAQAKVKAVEIQRELGAIGRMMGDKGQVQQILVNLCNNAIDAMPQGGKIIIRTSQRVIGERTWISLEVEDTGTGIPKDIQDKIFNPFFTTKEPGKGTGLGLSLVFEIVQRHQGKIELHSEPGKGTTFALAFPLNSGQGAAAGAAPRS